MRIAVVNDSEDALEMLRRLLSAVEGYEVVWTSSNGLDAVERCADEAPDIVLMDPRLSIMDGVEATRQIVASHPDCKVLVVTTGSESNMSIVYAAMGAGAIDSVALDRARPESTSQALLEKVATIEKLVGVRRAAPRPEESLRQDSGSWLPPLVVIGASTGGPQVLAQILSALPANLPAALVVVQHLDRAFSGNLSNWLKRQCELPVGLAEAGGRPLLGSILIASTNDHLILKPDWKLDYTAVPREYPYRPSVDVFFASVAKYWPTRGVAALLTGMGADGAKGLKALLDAGWHTIAQDERTSIVYGMPKAAAECGAAREILPAGSIAASIKKVIDY